MTDSQKTIDPSRFGEWNIQDVKPGWMPVVELLYHYELDAVGFVTSPELFMGGGEVVFGRDEPVFIRPEEGAGGERRSLLDPCISRHQFTLRWMASLEHFEVVVARGSRRALSLLSHEGEGRQPRYEKIHDRVMAKPGSFLVIGDRAILLLDNRPYRGEGFERLKMLGEHRALWQVRDEIAQVARFNRPVLVYGETGTGKELAARALHDSSDRSKGPFLAVNCGAIAESLVESHLFGYRKGAYTGAEKDSPGLFRSADGGSVFLDEIGELSLDLQKRLLRVLEEGAVMPVGLFKEVKVDVRVIAATNLDLEVEVERGRFREDLYYRLLGHVLTVPPLRERVSDVPRLFVHFLRRRRSEHQELGHLWRSVDGSQPPIPLDFFAGLLSDSWRGNVRQLQNVVEATASRNFEKGSFRAPSWREGSSPPPRPAPEEVDEAVEKPEEVDEEVPPRLDAALARVLESIGSARGTVLKLVPVAELVELELGCEGEPGSLARQLEARVVENLWALLEGEGFNQTRVAETLSMSRTTLVKLMQTLGFPRPRDLESSVILEAVARVGSDLGAVAGHLKVSRRGLQLRLSELNLEL